MFLTFFASGSTQIVANWEQSGNGFGQRDKSEDTTWGQCSEAHMRLEPGDNWSSYILVTMGHRVHHLYLWHLADTMGILCRVLNVLSPEVAAGNENCPTDTAAVQQPQRNSRNNRSRVSFSDDEDANVSSKKRRTERKQEAFRVGVVASLSSISLSQVQECLSREEGLIRGFKLALMEPNMTIPKIELCEELIEHHTNKAIAFEKEIETVRTGAAAILRSCTDGMA